jgi:pyruvate dehydrogenase E2 component (dihydrolipoamide acetyltransferase)
VSDVATNLIEVRVPDIGNYKDVEVIDVAVKAGDSIALEGALVTLETEKATMDVPSTAVGVIKEMKVQRGSRVSQGDVIAIVESSAASPAPAGEVARSAGEGPKPSPQPSPARAGEGVERIDEPGFARAHASPSIRKLARELGVDLAKVQGTGAKGRITDGDVKSFVKRALAGGAGAAAPAQAALPRVPVVDFAAFGPIERKPLSRIQKISGPRLHASWVNLPHVTQFDEADITDMEQARAGLKAQATERGLKLTPLAFVIRASVLALQQFPQFCASLGSDAGELVYKKYVHIGFAADTPNGLVVPVVRDADRKDVFELARDLAELSEKARAGKLAAAEMQGGCFTISSLGGIGGTAFTPIVNYPEVAILGMSRSSMQAVVREGKIEARLMLPLSLTYDHRVVDGADGARFAGRLCQLFSDPMRLLMES